MTETDFDDDFSPPAAQPAQTRSRFRRLRKFTLWVVGIVAVIVLLLFISRWQVGRMGQRQLTVQTEQLNETDPGWKLDAILDERKKHEPAAEKNSALDVQKIAGDIPKEWHDWRKSEEANRFWAKPAENHLPPAEAIEAARKPLPPTHIVRTEAIRLQNARTGAFAFTIAPDPIATNLSHLNHTREVAGLLQYDAYIATLDKKPNRGIQSARAILGIARAIGDEPFLVSQFVRIACAAVAAKTAMQVLAWGEPTEWLAELQAELLTEADVPWFRYGMRGERAMLDRVFRGLEDGTISAESWFSYAGITNPGPQHYAAFKAYRALIPGDHAKSLEITTAYLEAQKLPHHEQLAAMKQIEIPKGPPDDFRYIITRLMVPATDKVAESGLRTRANLLAAATCIACERFRLKHKRWPRDLAELTPEFLSAVPVNPFDGKPLSYRIYPDRIAVYCFWENAPRRMDDVPEDFRHTDPPGVGLGFRVWNPPQRALPPLEKKDP